MPQAKESPIVLGPMLPCLKPKESHIVRPYVAMSQAKESPILTGPLLPCLKPKKVPCCLALCCHVSSQRKSHIDRAYVAMSQARERLILPGPMLPCLKPKACVVMFLSLRPLFPFPISNALVVMFQSKERPDLPCLPT